MTGGISASNLSGVKQNNPSGNEASVNTLDTGSFLRGLADVSTGFSKYSEYKSQVGADNFNASIARGNASNIGAETASNEASLKLFQDQKIGQQRANLAEANIGPISEGSAADAITTSERNANMQLLQQRYKGNVAQVSSKNSAALDEYYAKVASSNASTELMDTGAGAIGSMFKGYALYKSARF